MSLFHSPSHQSIHSDPAVWCKNVQKERKSILSLSKMFIKKRISVCLRRVAWSRSKEEGVNRSSSSDTELRAFPERPGWPPARPVGELQDGDGRGSVCACAGTVLPCTFESFSRFNPKKLTIREFQMDLLSGPVVGGGGCWIISSGRPHTEHWGWGSSAPKGFGNNLTVIKLYGLSLSMRSTHSAYTLWIRYVPTH